ncbi:MAG: DUF87 domain-containing protein [bacterium]|nr:DUF87 domain-containing protein [bacterium]
MDIFFIIYLLVLTALFLVGFGFVDNLRKRGAIARALNMSLFLVTLPREAFSAGQGQAQRPEKEVISIMEQLYSSFTNLHSKGWNKFIYGEPYISLEMAVHHIGEEIHFYVAVPKSYEQIFEKQAHGVFPMAELERIKDYNIFNPQGVSVGAHLKLKENPILPVRTYQRLEADPLGAIANSLSKLEKEGEGAAIQILIRPSHHNEVRTNAQKVAKEMQSGHDFKTALKRVKKPLTKEEKQKEAEKATPQVVTPFDQEMVKSIQSKSSRPLFDTNVRLIVSASDKFRADQILQNLSESFVQFASPDMNSFVVNKPSEGRFLRRLLFNFSFRLFAESNVLILSSEEITSLYHFPFSSAAAPKIKFLKSKPAEPPPNLPQAGIILGKNLYRSEERVVRMTDDDRRRHLYTIGQTGTGKSTLMKAMLRQDIENGKGVCLIDPHGEFAEFALSIVPKNRVDDIIYFDPGDVDRPMGLNMLEIDPTHPEQKTRVIDELFGIFDTLYDLKTTGGPMFEKYFKNSALLLLDDYEHDIPTLADISRVLVNSSYRADKLSRETNPLVKEFWQLEAEKAGGEASLANMAPYISSKVTSFIYNEFLRPIINQKKSSFNFRDIMDSQKILIVNLSKGRIGDLNANLLGMVIVGKLLMAALSRIDIIDEKMRKDFYLYIDEFQNFTTDSISIILSEARKYRLNLIVAHQFIKQLKDNIRDAVFGNVGSIVAFRIGPDDAEFMKNKFEPVFSPQDLINIDNLNAYVSLLINGQTTRPFNIKLQTEIVFGAGSPEVAKMIKEMSRLKYGRPRDEIEKEIQERVASVIK